MHGQGSLRAEQVINLFKRGLCGETWHNSAVTRLLWSPAKGGCGFSRVLTSTLPELTTSLRTET